MRNKGAVLLALAGGLVLVAVGLGERAARLAPDPGPVPPPVGVEMVAITAPELPIAPGGLNRLSVSLPRGDNRFAVGDRGRAAVEYRTGVGQPVSVVIAVEVEDADGWRVLDNNAAAAPVRAGYARVELPWALGTLAPGRYRVSAAAYRDGPMAPGARRPALDRAWAYFEVFAAPLVPAPDAAAVPID